jgi:hypothetical protein
VQSWSRFALLGIRIRHQAVARLRLAGLLPARNHEEAFQQLSAAFPKTSALVADRRAELYKKAEARAEWRPTSAPNTVAWSRSSSRAMLIPPLAAVKLSTAVENAGANK